jgi:hypothetical protein
VNTTVYPIRADAIDWVPLREGLSLRPLYFADDGYAGQLRIEPGVLIPRHRHTGHVHAYNLAGSRELIETGEIAGPGTYVYEPPGNVDSWRCVGEVPCIVHLSLTGCIEYLDDRGAVREVSSTRTAREAYVRWCRAQRVEPDHALFRRMDWATIDLPCDHRSAPVR